MKTENELIIAVRSGDKDAFGEIIDRFTPLVESLTAGYITDELFTPSDRDDLVQEATIALYNAVMSFDVNQTEVTFGLYAKICLSNSLNSALRRRRRQLAADKASTVEDLPYQYDPEPSDAKLLLARIEAFLSKGEREVLKLRLRGLSVAEIARELGKNEKSVSNAVFRIRQKISKLL